MTQRFGQGVPATLSAEYQDATGTLVVPGSPLVSIVDPLGATVVAATPPTNDGVGLYHYTYTIGAAALLGVWTAHWTGVINGVPVVSDDPFEVVAGGTVTFPGAVGETCSPWATAVDVRGCGPCAAVADTVDLSEEIAVASDLLYLLTGRRWPGSCTTTDRPCTQGHCFCHGGAYDCRARSDWCCRPPEVLLSPGPATSILEVLVDGAALPAAQYRLDEGGTKLVRLADPTGVIPYWPACQLQARPTTEQGTFAVSYRYGLGPPAGGVRAAASLACQLYLACHPDAGTCQLPKRVTQITSQGVTAVLLDPFQFFNEGKTGVYDVDLWVSSVNPNHLSERGVAVDPRNWPRARRI